MSLDMGDIVLGGGLLCVGLCLFLLEPVLLLGGTGVLLIAVARGM